MGCNVEVEVVSELCVNAPGIPPPFSFSLKEEDVVFKSRIDRSAFFGKDADMQPFAHIMGIVVNVNILRLLALFKAIEIDTLLVVLAHVVTDDYVAVLLFHDSTEPQVVVTVVILDECINTVVVGIESSAIPSSLAHVPIGLVILDLDAIGIEAEDTVPRTVATAVSQRVLLIDGILANSCNDAIASGMVYVVICNVNLCP